MCYNLFCFCFFEISNGRLNTFTLLSVYTSKIISGTTYYGWFLQMNQFWNNGYTTLNLTASVTQSGLNKYFWSGRVFISPSGGIITIGGAMYIIEDYASPSYGNTR